MERSSAESAFHFTQSGNPATKLIVSTALKKAGFTNAFSTRTGGVSGPAESDLNLADRDDAPAKVAENRRRFRSALGIGDTVLMTIRQTHSDRCVVLERPGPEPDGDALIWTGAGRMVGVKTADCVPILIADPATGAFAAVHAGWKGTAQRIAEKAVRLLSKATGEAPAGFLAAAGPAACGRCYEVGPEVIASFREAHPDVDAFSEPTRNGRRRIDVREANRRQLIRAGIVETGVAVAPFCTIHQPDLFFSHRRDHRHAAPGNPVGRHLSVIGRPL